MKIKSYTNRTLLVLAFALLIAFVFPARAYATEAEYDPNVPYEGDIVTGAGDKGNNHTASVILVDETGNYPGGNILITFEDLTGAHSKTVRFQEAIYKGGVTYDVYLVAPGTFNVSSNIEDGYQIVDTLTGESFTKYAAYGESGIVLLSIRAEGEEAGGTETTSEPSAILNGNIPGEMNNADAQEVYQEFIDSISFIATDDTWTQILEIKGKMGLDEKTYNSVLKGDNKIPYEELSDFDLFVYNYTYVAFASAKNGSADYWNTHTADREALSFFYQDYLNFKPTEGNNREAVNAAFEKLWDWQYEYIVANNEPYDFILNCSYSALGFGVSGSGTENKPLDNTGLTEEDKQVIIQEIEDEEVPLSGDTPWHDVMDGLSHSLLSIGIFVVSLIGLAIVLFIKHRKTVEEYTEE